MSSDKFQAKMLSKMAKPLISTFVEPGIKTLLAEKSKIVLQENEVEICILLQDKGGQLIASAPIFDNTGRISRYHALSEDSEAVNLTDLILKFTKAKK